MDNLSTALDPVEVLHGVPDSLRARLVATHRDLKASFLRGDHDACGLRAGKFCEVVLRVLEDQLGVQSTPFGSKINMSEACRDLEKRPKASGPETLRVIIPRAVEFLYTLRNKRDIGHVGGDVDANVIDSIMIVRLADWILAELVRVTHKVSLEEAQSVVDALATREVPVVWAVGGKKRVLNPSLTFREKSLLILYANETVSLVEDLFDWVEYSDLSHYKRDVLKRLHAAKLVEFDEILGTVELSPTGAAWVERHLHPADLFLA